MLYIERGQGPTLEAVRGVKALIREIVARHGGCNIRVFGSRAHRSGPAVNDPWQRLEDIVVLCEDAPDLVDRGSGCSIPEHR